MGSRKAVAPKRNVRAGKTSLAGAKVKRKYRRSPDVKARWEIIKQKRKVTPEYTTAAIDRLMREIATEQSLLNTDLRFKALTREVLSEAALDFTVDLMMTGADAMEHDGRQTIMPRDLYVDRRFREYAHEIYNRMMNLDYEGPMTCYIPRGLRPDEQADAMRRRYMHKEKRGLLTKKERAAGMPQQLVLKRRVRRAAPKKAAAARTSAKAEAEAAPVQPDSDSESEAEPDPNTLAPASDSEVSSQEEDQE